MEKINFVWYSKVKKKKNYHHRDIAIPCYPDQSVFINVFTVNHISLSMTLLWDKVYRGILNQFWLYPWDRCNTGEILNLWCKWFLTVFWVLYIEFILDLWNVSVHICWKSLCKSSFCDHVKIGYSFFFMYRRHYFTAHVLILCLLQSFWPIMVMFLEAWK